MSNEVTIIENNQNNFLNELKNTQMMCEALLRMPHYQKMGAGGIFAIIEKAKALGISPMDALNGGFYIVQGKVEMTSSLMNQMIRQGGHSVTKDKKSNDQVCILHGKRADNGDTWVESYSINDAKQAGIYRNQWLKYPKDMLFARALSRLARQLFADVIKGCYVEGEIKDNFKEEEEEQPPVEKLSNDTPEAISDEQYQELEGWLGDNLKLRQNILLFLKNKWGIEALQDMPESIYDHALQRAKEQHVSAQETLGEEQQQGVAS